MLGGEMLDPNIAYIGCADCLGTTITRRPSKLNGVVIPQGVDCPHCIRGFIASGVSISKLEGLIDTLKRFASFAEMVSQLPEESTNSEAADMYRMLVTTGRILCQREASAIASLRKNWRPELGNWDDNLHEWARPKR